MGSNCGPRPWPRPGETRIDQGCDFGVETSLGTTDRLGGLTAGRIRGVLVNFDVGGVEQAQRSLSLLRQQIQQLGPQTAAIPAPPAGEDRGPRTELSRKITPRATRSKPEDHRLDHLAVVTGWPPALRRNRYRFPRSPVNFLSRSQCDSFRTRRPCMLIARTHHKTLSMKYLFTKPRFEDTP